MQQNSKRGQAKFSTKFYNREAVYHMHPEVPNYVLQAALKVWLGCAGLPIPIADTAG